MLNLKWMKPAAIAAGLQLAAPQIMVFAADAPVAPKAEKVKTVSDVVLTSNGELTGRVVTAQGKAVDGAMITVAQNGKTVAKTNTTENGDFKLASLKGGVYQVSAGQQVQQVRLWNQDAAPPSARPSALIVQNQVVRGQGDDYDYLETDEMVIAGVATAALVVGIVALVKAEDNDGNNNPASP
jgi:hypothetical protein